MQRPKNHRGIVALPSGKFLRVWKVFARSLNCPWKVSGPLERFLERLESCRIVWKVSKLSEKLPDCLESFRIVWNVSRWSENFLDKLESFWMVLKGSGWTSNLQFYVLFCRKSDLRTLSGKLLRVEICHPESSDFLGLCLVHWRLS